MMKKSFWYNSDQNVDQYGAVSTLPNISQVIYFKLYIFYLSRLNSTISDGQKADKHEATSTKWFYQMTLKSYISYQSKYHIWLGEKRASKWFGTWSGCKGCCAGRGPFCICLGNCVAVFMLVVCLWLNSLLGNIFYTFLHLLKVWGFFALETALIASLGVFSDVSVLVYFELTRHSARIVALVTLERFLSWMGPYVFLKACTTKAQSVSAGVS